jgi:hypothetical protein
VHRKPELFSKQTRFGSRYSYNKLGGLFMGIGQVNFDPNVVLDIYAEALLKQQDMVQKLTKVSMELQMQEQKMDTAVEALLDIFA